jgi:hypothetical protein
VRETLVATPRLDLKRIMFYNSTHKSRILQNLFFVTLIYLFFSCSENKNKVKTNEKSNQNYYDQNFIKNLKWDSLNAYVDIYFLKKGNKSVDTNFQFTLKRIGVYYYCNDEIEYEERILSAINREDTEKLFLTDTFTYYPNFECLLRMNWQIAYLRRPENISLLYLRVNDTSQASVNAFTSELRKENYVHDIMYYKWKPTHLDTVMFRTNKIGYVFIKLKSEYWTIEKVNEILDNLNSRPEVDEAAIRNIFKDIDRVEYIYHLKCTQRSSH